MSNLATLKPYPKGVSGNPAGKPKGAISILSAMKKELLKLADGDKTKLDMLVENMLKDGVKDDGQSRRLILQYIDGMPRETRDVNIREIKPMLDLTKDKQDGICNNNGHKTNIKPNKEGTGDSGGDISVKDDIDTDLSDKQSTG